MTTEAVLEAIPGGRALIDWFGHAPDFHDANLLEIALSSKGPTTLRIHTWQATDKVDHKGFYLLDKHIVVTITLETVTYVSLNNFNLPGIIFDLEITKIDDGYEFAWAGSYGVEGTLRAEQARLELLPGEPE